MTKKILILTVAVAIGAAFVGPALPADVAMPVATVVSPSVVYMASEGTWVTVHAEIWYSDVAGGTVTLNGIPAQVTFADNRGELVAKFDLDSVKDILTPGTMVMTLSGETEFGVPFMGTDEIRVIASKK